MKTDVLTEPKAGYQTAEERRQVEDDFRRRLAEATERPRYYASHDREPMRLAPAGVEFLPDPRLAHVIALLGAQVGVLGGMVQQRGAVPNDVRVTPLTRDYVRAAVMLVRHAEAELAAVPEVTRSAESEQCDSDGGETD